MKPTLGRRFAVVAALISAALLAAGTGYACDGGGAKAQQASFASFHHGHHHHHGWWKDRLFVVTADYLGISTQTLKNDLKNGKTISEVAPAGKTAAGLADAFKAALKTKLDRKVAAGRISQADEDAVLANAGPKLDMFAAKLWTMQFGHEQR